jgi:hypothetical protein
MANQQSTNIPDIEKIVNNILTTIEKEREREIISRRFGLFDRKETLEQIGELLGITRERVRQLEKAVLTKLKQQAEQGKVPHIEDFQIIVIDYLKEHGSAARISNISASLNKENTKIDQSRVAFISVLCPQLVIVDENDNYYLSAAIAKEYSQKTVTQKIDKVVAAIKKIGEPTTIDKISNEVSEDEAKTAALASMSKKVATLNNRWGLIKWPMVNPKNIRDKIYVILFEHGKQMHFSEISEAIKKSDFKRKDVTTQAIHNELIKDPRFVLVGRGIYALKEWGYKKGTVADVITDVIQKAGEPLHRDEIVKRVLKDRYVKETTILLNLQGKPQFKRVAKATYTLAK